LKNRKNRGKINTPNTYIHNHGNLTIKWLVSIIQK